MISIIFLVVTLLLLYQIPYVKQVVNNRLPKRILNGTLDKQFMVYPYLSENKAESAHYNILKVTGRKPHAILFDTENKNFILTGDALYLTTVRKINAQGEEIDSIKIQGHLYPSGVYFYDDYYIDWVVTGNKERQKYDDILDYDTLSKTEFKRYLSEADIIEFTWSSKKDNHYKGRCHIKIKDKWLLIESAKLFNELETDYDKDYFEIRHKQKDYLKKNANRLVPLKNAIEPFYHWEKQGGAIFIQHFVKEYFVTRSLGDFNNHGAGTGWYGTAYFQLTHNTEILHFKSSAFKESENFSSSLCPSISIYYPDKQYRLDIAFIQEKGIYILKRKQSAAIR